MTTGGAASDNTATAGTKTRTHSKYSAGAQATRKCEGGRREERRSQCRDGAPGSRYRLCRRRDAAAAAAAALPATGSPVYNGISGPAMFYLPSQYRPSMDATPIRACYTYIWKSCESSAMATPLEIDTDLSFFFFPLPSRPQAANERGAEGREGCQALIFSERQRQS